MYQMPTVAEILENQSNLQGVDIEQSSCVRMPILNICKYHDLLAS